MDLVRFGICASRPDDIDLLALSIQFDIVLSGSKYCCQSSVVAYKVDSYIAE